MKILRAAAQVSKLLCAGSQSFAMHDKSYRLMTSISAVRRFRNHTAGANLRGSTSVGLVDFSAQKLYECPALMRSISCKKVKERKKKDCKKSGNVTCPRCQNTHQCKPEEIEDPCPCLEPGKKPKKKQKKRCKKKKCTGEIVEEDEK